MTSSSIMTLAPSRTARAPVKAALAGPVLPDLCATIHRGPPKNNKPSENAKDAMQTDSRTSPKTRPTPARSEPRKASVSGVRTSHKPGQAPPAKEATTKAMVMRSECNLRAMTQQSQGEDGRGQARLVRAG